MIFKIIGSIFIIFSTTMFSLYIESKHRVHIKDIEEMKKGFNLFSNSIRYTHLPLEEVMTEISQKLSGISAEIFKKTGEYLSERKFESAKEAWENVINESFKKSNFEKEDIDIFMYFGKTIGYLDFESQYDNGKYIIEHIDLTLNNLRNKLEKIQKMYRSLGILSGLGIVIILF